MSKPRADANPGIREIRINPIVPSESVLVATARSMRPKKAEEPAPRDTRQHVDECPFCSGNEHLTPPEITRVGSDDHWDIRIVENLYPVLGDDRSQPNLNFGLQQTIDGYVLVFKNFGPAAGASIAHTHSQIIAMPVIPDNVQAEVENSRNFYNKQQRCIFCTLVDEAHVDPGASGRTETHDGETGPTATTEGKSKGKRQEREEGSEHTHALRRTLRRRVPRRL